MAPHFLDHHDSPSNLAESRYPPPPNTACFRPLDGVVMSNLNIYFRGGFDLYLSVLTFVTSLSFFHPVFACKVKQANRARLNEKVGRNTEFFGAYRLLIPTAHPGEPP